MISLVITIIAIALAIALSAAAVYYVKDYASSGNSRAKSTQSVTEGSQIAGAFELFRADNDGKLPIGDQEEIKSTLLSTEYLKQWPQKTWELQNDYAILTDVTPEMCININKKVGFDGIPACNDVAIDRRSICCSTGSEVTVPPGTHSQIPGRPLVPDAETPEPTPGA